MVVFSRDPFALISNVCGPKGVQLLGSEESPGIDLERHLIFFCYLEFPIVCKLHFKGVTYFQRMRFAYVAVPVENQSTLTFQIYFQL